MRRAGSSPRIAPTPTLSPSTGQFPAGTVVELSANVVGTIRYTTDGSRPTVASPIYTTPVPITGPWMVLRAYVSAFGLDDSADVTATYVLDAPSAPVATPTFDIAPGLLASDTAIPVSCATAGATLYYTTTSDGSTPPDPTTADSVYAGPVPLVYPFGKIKVIGVKAGMTTSAVASGSWTFTRPAIVAIAEFEMDPAVANIVYGTGLNVATWRNIGTAGAALDVTQATDAKRLVWANNSGPYGGPALTGSAAAGTFLRSAVGTYPWNQPSTLLFQARQTGGVNRLMADGDSGTNKRALYFSTSSQLSIAGTTTLNNNGAGATSTTAWGMWWGVYNGATSRAGREDESFGVWPPGPVTGDAGSSAANGITLGAWGNGNLNFDGPIAYAIGWKQAVAEADLLKAREYIDGKSSGAPIVYKHIICDGDSWTIGSGESSTLSYPIQMQPLLGTPIYQVSNFGISGNQIDVIRARFYATVLPRFVPGRVNVYVGWAGGNNITHDHDAASTLAEMYAFYDEVRSYGYKLIAIDFPTANTINPFPSREACRQAVNADMRINILAHADAFYDVAADPRFFDYMDETYRLPDHGHFNAAGKAIQAAAVAPLVVAIS